jgi:glycine cleavage system H protein
MSMKFSSDHVWIESKDGITRIGITEHAQDALGDIVFVELPQAGKSFAKGEVVAVIESVKAAADVFSPASVKVLKINPLLKDDPALANSDPLASGWLLEVELSVPSELDSLMDLSPYLEFCKS